MMPFITDEGLARFVDSPVSPLPTFRHVQGDSLCNSSENTMLIGDAIHTVKPYFGMGANSAFQDVSLLSEAIRGEAGAGAHAWRRAIRAFSDRRAADAQALVRISHALDGDLFVPLIVVDSLFHRLAPSLFNPNVIRMLQDDRFNFTDVERIKLRERVVQWSLLAAALAALLAAAGGAARLALAFVQRVLLAAPT